MARTRIKCARCGNERKGGTYSYWYGSSLGSSTATTADYGSSYEVTTTTEYRIEGKGTLSICNACVLIRGLQHTGYAITCVVLMAVYVALALALLFYVVDPLTNALSPKDRGLIILLAAGALILLGILVVGYLGAGALGSVALATLALFLRQGGKEEAAAHVGTSHIPNVTTFTTAEYVALTRTDVEFGSKSSTESTSQVTKQDRADCKVCGANHLRSVLKRRKGLCLDCHRAKFNQGY